MKLRQTRASYNAIDGSIVVLELLGIYSSADFDCEQWQ